jgi:hypothetical protein
MDHEDWRPDPFGAHEERLFRHGEPTPLVRDQGAGAYDPPPPLPPPPRRPPASAEPTAEAGGPKASDPTGRKVGWYRDRATGQRRLWNGTEWVDLAHLVTPFTFDAAEPAEAPPLPPAPVPPPSLASRWRATDKYTRWFLSSAAAVVVILAIVVSVVPSGPKPVSLAAGTLPTSPRPADPAAGGAEPTTTTDQTSTTTTPVTTTTASTTTTGAAATAAGGSTPVPSTSSSSIPGSDDVAIIGDSITELSAPDIQRALRDYNVYIDAAGGTKIAQHLANIQQLAGDGQPRDWVIELGTNDALGENPDWANDFASEVTAVQAQPCVVFVTVNPSLGSVADGIDGAISAAVASHPNFHLLDWGDMEFRNPDWLMYDHIHPSISGRMELAKLEKRAIDDCQT